MPMASATVTIETRIVNLWALRLAGVLTGMGLPECVEPLVRLVEVQTRIAGQRHWRPTAGLRLRREEHTFVLEVV
jgi:hypothetical protein